MPEMFAVRNVDDKTKGFILSYATEHHLNVSEALREIVMFAQEHLKESGKRRKYQSIFSVYDMVKFSKEVQG